MKKHLAQLALSALFVMGTVSVPAFAQSQPQQQQPATVPAGPINYKLLNLTPDQVKKFNQIRLDFNKQAIKLKADIQLKQLEIQKQLMAPAVNQPLLNKLMQEKLALDSKLQKASLDSFVAFKKLLTPQQLALLPQAITLR